MNYKRGNILSEQNNIFKNIEVESELHGITPYTLQRVLDRVIKRKNKKK